MGTGIALVGRTLAGRFKITSYVGEGAMACVYRGVQEGSPRDVAVKVMHPHLSSDRTFVARFRREAKAASQIQHENSVRIFDTGVDGTLLYIAMELLTGQDLFDVLVKERRLSELEAARILLEVLAALEEAHAQGIVHRDLKPENIMLVRDPERPDGRVKVLDFGIAKILERDAPGDSDDPPESLSSLQVTALTNAGVVVGTPAYMSPEQCRGEAIDARSDLYACGVLLYQLVTGKLPFPGVTAMDFAVMHVRRPPTPAREVVPGVHPGLEALMLRALDKLPAMRQPTARAMIDDLKRLVPELAREPHVDADGAPDVEGLRLASEADAPRQITAEPRTMRRGAIADEPTEDSFATLASPSSPRGDAVDASAVATQVVPASAAVSFVVDPDAAPDTPTRLAVLDPASTRQPIVSEPPPETPTRAQLSLAKPPVVQPAAGMPWAYFVAAAIAGVGLGTALFFFMR